jgi:hypothetical protein
MILCALRQKTFPAALPPARKRGAPPFRLHARAKAMLALASAL